MLIAETASGNTHWVVTVDGEQRLACASTKPLPKRSKVAEAAVRRYNDGTPYTETPVCHRCNGVNWNR